MHTYKLMLWHSPQTRGSYLRSPLHLIKNTFSATPKHILMLFGQQQKEKYVYLYLTRFKLFSATIHPLNQRLWREIMIITGKRCISAVPVLWPLWEVFDHNKIWLGHKKEAATKNKTHNCIKRLKVIFTAHIITRWWHTIISDAENDGVLYSCIS